MKVLNTRGGSFLAPLETFDKSEISAILTSDPRSSRGRLQHNLHFLVGELRHSFDWPQKETHEWAVLEPSCDMS